MGALRVLAQGQTLVLTAASNASGTTLPLYSDAGMSSLVTLPLTMSADTTLYGRDGLANLTVTHPDGTVVFSGAVALGTNLQSIAPALSLAQISERLSKVDGKIATQATADAATYAPIGPTIANLASPIIVPHKGGLLVAPEDSPTAARYGLTCSVAPAVDIDARRLADGSYANMHDATVNRTTTSTGNVSSFDAITWKTLTINATGLLAGSWTNTDHPDLVSEMLHSYGRKAIFTIEVKDATTAACTDLVNLVTRLGLQKSVAISCATIGALAPAVSAGLYTQYISDSATSTAVKAAGVSSVIFTTAVSDANITAMIGAGVDVWVYDVTRRWQLAHYQGLGVRGIFTGDPAYLAATTALRTTDPFASGYWFPGVQLSRNDRGILTGGNLQLGSAGENSSILLGCLCPVANAASSYTITFTFTFTAVGGSGSAYAFIHICEPDDTAFPNNISSGGYTSGYKIRVDQTGSLGIYKDVSGGSETLLQGHGGSAPTNGTQTIVTVAVTPSSITASIPAQSGVTVTTNDTDYRGGYIHCGQAGLGSSLVSALGTLSIT